LQRPFIGRRRDARNPSPCRQDNPATRRLHDAGRPDLHVRIKTALSGQKVFRRPQTSGAAETHVHLKFFIKNVSL